MYKIIAGLFSFLINFPVAALNEMPANLKSGYTAQNNFFDKEFSNASGQTQFNFKHYLEVGKIDKIASFIEKNNFPAETIKTLLEDFVPEAGYQELMLVDPRSQERNWKMEFNFWVLRCYVRAGQINKIDEYFKKHDFPHQKMIKVLQQLAERSGYYELAAALSSEIIWKLTWNATLQAEVAEVNYYKSKLFNAARCGKINVIEKALLLDLEEKIGENFMQMTNEKGQTLSYVSLRQGYNLLSKLLENNFKKIKILFSHPSWENHRIMMVEEVIDQNTQMVYSAAESQQKMIAKNIFTWRVFSRIRKQYEADREKGEIDRFVGTYLSFALKNSQHWDDKIWHFIDKKNLFLNIPQSIDQNNIGHTLRKDRRENVFLAKDKIGDRKKLKDAIKNKDIMLIDELIKNGIDLSYTDRSGITFSDIANKEGENILAFALQTPVHWQLFDPLLLQDAFEN